MARTRILHIIKSLGRGGAEMLLPEAIKVHNRDQFEFHCLYFLPWKNQMVQALEDNGVKVKCLASNTNIHLMLKAKAAAAYVRENRIQLIHAHLPWAGILARVVGKMTGVPVVYTEHNKQERYHKATRMMNLATMNWLNEVIAVSSDVEQSIRKHKPALKPSVTTILNGVNVEYFSPGKYDGEALRNSLNISSDSPVIGTIAVFRFQKRLDLWLGVAKAIAGQVPAARFVIVGDGPLKDELLEKCNSLDLDGKVFFVGLQAEVRPYLAAFDIYMMSSIFEGLPIAMLEAMASGCPVVSTDAGGIKEVIRHETDGLLCSVDEPQQLADLALQLISDPAKRLQLSAQGRKRVIDAFSMEKMVRQLEVTYENVLRSSDAADA